MKAESGNVTVKNISLDVFTGFATLLETTVDAYR